MTRALPYGVSPAEWIDWRWQLAHVVRTADELSALVNFSKEEFAGIEALFAKLSKPGSDAVRLTPFLVSLIDWNNPNDPIYKQHIPDARELNQDLYSLNKVWERPEDFADGTNRFIQQKYPDIILLRLASMCNAFCRFCFEKERTLRQGVKTAIGPAQFKQALETIESKKAVRQVLISGGDPLVIPDEILLRYVSDIANIPHISTIRINTRSLLHNPFRITNEFASGLAAIKASSWKNPKRERGMSIEIGVHFNHPKELSPESFQAIRLLREHGLELYNQSVLLKGINDEVEVLADLFRALRQENVRLHYLSHAMPVPGTEHLRTSVVAGQRIMKELLKKKEFRGQLPHYETSHFSGKQIVPIPDPDFKVIRGPRGQEIHFVSDITGKEEIQPDVV